MKPEEANQLLQPGYLPFEAGYQRLDNGILLVAARSSLINVKGHMIDWWFSYVHTTEQYKQWHPEDHVYSDWIGERGTGKYIGGTHIAHEKLGGDTVHKLKINFRSPSELLATEHFTAAGVSTAVHARLGEDGAPGWTAKMVHLVRDTSYGCEMRSRFWLGCFADNELENDYDTRVRIYPDEVGTGLQKHCHEEMSILGQFLPALYQSYHL
ncbi:hydrolase [Chitinophaga varians]|uniref:Hydrolase n=1 Tax=Chitinophaga varians TaxID=2202339 RepID=A0A847RUL6_9BACT|nr:hydrolase [Chitinophaga varians]NLR63051.1 hydrolase [Chitinophaga varians]